MNQNNKLFLGILFTLLFVFSMVGSAQVYHVNTITTNEGLISNHINDMSQDDDGYLWVSSDKGLSKYDGIHWQYFEAIADMPVALNTEVKLIRNIPIIAGGSKSHWFSIYFLNNEKWEEIKLPPNVLVKGQYPKWEATALGKSIGFHCLTNDNLYSYIADSSLWLITPIPQHLINKQGKLRAYQEKLYWIGGEGVYEIRDREFLPVLSFTSSLISAYGELKNITDLVQINDSLIYILGEFWIGEIRSGKFRILLNEPDNKPLNQLSWHPKGYLFFRSNQKLQWLHLESGESMSFLTDNDDIHALMSNLFIDKMGTLWISSYRGLHAISNFMFLTYNLSNGNIRREVSLIMPFGKNRLLVGGVNGYTIFEKDKIIAQKELISNKQQFIRFLNGDSINDQIYVIAQNYGLGKFNQNTNEFKWNQFPDISLLAIRNVNDTLWLSAQEGRLYYLKNDKLVEVHQLIGYTRNIFKGPNNSLLVCTNDGLVQINGKSVKHYNYAKDISLKNVYCAFEQNDTIYLGTEAGLARLDHEEIVTAQYNGISVENPIYAFLLDHTNALWMGTDNGLFIIDKSGLINLNEKDGLVGSEINRSALVQTRDNKILIGTNRALAFYSKPSLSTIKEVFPLEINWIKVNDQQYVHPWQDLKLAADVRNISIGFKALSLNNESIKFRYKLLGLEEDWQLLDNEKIREIVYKNLPSGEFQLEIQYQLKGQDWSSSTISKTFTKVSPYYLQWWFIISVGVAIGALGYFTHQVSSQIRLNVRLRETIKIKVNEVKENESKLKLALENSRLGVWSYDLITGESDYTQEVYNFLDLAPDSPKLARINYLFNLHDEDADRVHQALKDAMASGQPYDVEFRSRQRDGSYKWLHGKGKCSYNDKGEPVKLTGTISDISRRKNFEAERERLINELKRANEELDRFVYSVSHDLSAPIKSIKGLINLTRIAKNEEEIKTYIGLIETSVEKQDKFIKEIMDYAYNARKDISIENVNVYQITKDVIEGLAFSDDAQKESIKVLIDPNTEIACDKLRLRIILNNLISNAIKFKKQSRHHGHQVVISADRTEAGFSLSVSDNGMGIDQASIDKIFNMFYRATDTVSGSGLGLYIAKDAAEKMGFQLKVESTIGTGSTFSIISNKKTTNS